MKIDLIVTRHPGLVGYLRELGIVAEGERYAPTLRLMTCVGGTYAACYRIRCLA